MTFLADSNYGVLQPVVSDAGSIMAAGGAIALAWRGRTAWEPSEEDLSGGPQKVGGLIGAILIVILWVYAHGSPKDHFLIPLIIAAAVTCFVALCAYSFLIAVQTYSRVSVVDGKAKAEKVVGGFVLKPEAKEIKKKHAGLTVQRLLEGSAYDVDRVWTRPSRALAKLLFVVGYLGLVISGTVALASAAILISGI
jgi:hypothetical protein